MTSPWIEHVRNYSKKHNVPYEQAMSEAKSSYKPKTGGSLKTDARKAKNTTKTIARKTKNTANRASDFIDKNGHYVSYIDADMGKNLNDINTGIKGVSNSASAVGGNFNLGRKVKNTVKKTKTIARKANNTVNKAEKIGRKVRNTTSKVLDYAAPIASFVDPEIGISLMAANKVIGGALGQGKNPYLIGGSFKTSGGSFRTSGAGLKHSCSHCGATLTGAGIGFGRAQSSVLSDTHNSFKPLKPRPFADR